MRRENRGEFSAILIVACAFAFATTGAQTDPNRQNAFPSRRFDEIGGFRQA